MLAADQELTPERRQHDHDDDPTGAFFRLNSHDHDRDRGGSRAGVPLILLRLEGAATLAAASLAYAELSGRWLVFASLFLLPDLSMLGYLVGRRVGAACYNAGHSYVGPAVLAGCGVVLGLHALFCVACIWVAHVGFDRMLGYGLKYGTSFGDTHLGHRGERSAAAE